MTRCWDHVPAIRAAAPSVAPLQEAWCGENKEQQDCRIMVPWKVPLVEGTNSSNMFHDHHFCASAFFPFSPSTLWAKMPFGALPAQVGLVCFPLLSPVLKMEA